MLSAHDLYKISAQLCRVLNNLEEPFGGVSMIFAGDFAQLPPVIGHEGTSLYSRTIGAISTNLKKQEEALGKAVWHQITTVVILRKNMRMTEQTSEDQKFRTALENMRYRSCTTQDIAFLRTRMNGTGPGQPNVCHPDFRNVPIITARNIHKDEINRLGALRFASETGQVLTDFYSDDSPARSFNGKDAIGVSTIPMALQEELWNQYHSCTDKHIAGKLSLCKGMPVMIRHNAATELCITKGQEGTIYGWQSSTGQHGQRVLETLFIELTNPPNPVQFEGLPPNVIPMPRASNSITCMLPDDTRIAISRLQVEVLLNFSLTDYASQGKTRPYNVVDLFKTSSHQGYYTALSRSATAAGTLILQGFDSRLITGGASGALRQEFRDMELLDEITLLRYEGKLHESVVGSTRISLIQAFRDWKGLNYVPKIVHKAIRWNSDDPMLEATIDELPWRIIPSDKKNTRKEVEKNAEAALPSHGSQDLKRKTQSDPEPSGKKRRTVRNINQPFGEDRTYIPEGLIWSNNSCAYDAALTVFYTIWKSDPTKWSAEFTSLNPGTLKKVAKGFEKVQQLQCSLEDSRDVIRRSLAADRQRDFRWGSYVSCSLFLGRLMETAVPVRLYSNICDAQHETRQSRVKTALLAATNVARNYRSIKEWMENYEELWRDQHVVCRECGGPISHTRKFTRAPKILGFDFEGAMQFEVNPCITIQVEDRRCKYDLRGIIYFGDSHYASRVVVNQNQVWFHDGISTGRNMIYDGLLTPNLDLSTCRGKTAQIAIYTLSD